MTVSSFNGYRRNDDYLRDVARGGVEGAEPFPAYGKRVTSGAESNILWPNGTYVMPPAAGATVDFVSTDAQDSAAGTGIRTLNVIYLDSSLTQKTAAVALDGLTPVVGAITDVRFIQCMYMTSWGSGKSAAGAISAYNGLDTYSYITAGAKRCSSSVRMVPAGKRLLVLGAVGGLVSGTAAANGTIAIVSSKFFDTDYAADSIFIEQAELAYQDGSFGLPFPIPMPFYEGTAVGMAFTTDKGATATGTWFGILENL